MERTLRALDRAIVSVGAAYDSGKAAGQDDDELDSLFEDWKFLQVRCARSSAHEKLTVACGRARATASGAISWIGAKWASTPGCVVT